MKLPSTWSTIKDLSSVSDVHMVRDLKQTSGWLLPYCSWHSRLRGKITKAMYLPLHANMRSEKERGPIQKYPASQRSPYLKNGGLERQKKVRKTLWVENIAQTKRLSRMGNPDNLDIKSLKTQNYSTSLHVSFQRWKGWEAHGGSRYVYGSYDWVGRN